MKTKIRADELVVLKGLAESKTKATSLIMAGKVYHNEQRIEKSGQLIPINADIHLKSENIYVSRGGLKLASAISHFSISVNEKIAIDIGASTGGFTDCLLKNGALKVYSVDVGYGLLDQKLRNDEKVVCLEKINFRNIDKNLIKELVDIVTIDVSFISLKAVLPNAIGLLKPKGELIALVKPQFELSAKEVAKGGVVKDESLRMKAVSEIESFLSSNNMNVVGFAPSSILGQKGNQEYLIYALKKYYLPSLR